jgi:RNA polymerase sigma factor (sigma-70 family)
MPDSHPSPLDRDSFEELVQRASLGSQEAVWTLLDRYSKNILRVVRRHLPAGIRSKVDSADIVQSVWKSLLRKGARLEAGATPEQLIAYLAGMARLKVYETHRHFTTLKGDLRREQALGHPATPEESNENYREVCDKRAQRPDVIVSARDNWERAIELSGDRGRQVVDLRLRGLTLTEIAEQLNISLSTVRRVLDSLLQSITT